MSVSGKTGETRWERRGGVSLGVAAGGLPPGAEAGGVPLGAGAGWAPASDGLSTTIARANATIPDQTRAQSGARSLVSIMVGNVAGNPSHDP
jgi:hypothetical protein